MTARKCILSDFDGTLARRSGMWSAALLESVGRFAPSLRCELAVLRMHLRSIYLDPATWHVFEDVLPSLTALDRDGWKHAVLSNHVPELAQSMSHLGIRDRFVDVFSSASLGFEKPNARAFHHARQALGDPEVLWMVGDSYAVDVAGANRAGLPAVLLRSRHDEAKCQCDSLIDLADVLAA